MGFRIISPFLSRLLTKPVVHTGQGFVKCTTDRLRQARVPGAGVVITLTTMRVWPRKFSYSPSSVIGLAIVSDIYKTHVVCSQLLDMKCLFLFYLKLTFIR